MELLRKKMKGARIEYVGEKENWANWRYIILKSRQNLLMDWL